MQLIAQNLDLRASLLPHRLQQLLLLLHLPAAQLKLLLFLTHALLESPVLLAEALHHRLVTAQFSKRLLNALVGLRTETLHLKPGLPQLLTLL